MKIEPGSIQSRVAITRLLEKLEEHPEYSRKYGITDTSHYRMEHVTKSRSETDQAL